MSTRQEEYLGKKIEDGRGKIEDSINPSSPINLPSSLIKEIIIPAIEKEVNEGKNFAQLRQIYHSLILATWYKKNLKKSLFGQVYVDKNKTKGVDVEDKQIKQKIYEQYLAAFKKGTYDYIKEDYNPATQEVVSKKYFSGGVDAAMIGRIQKEKTDLTQGDLAQLGKQLEVVKTEIHLNPKDAAMLSDSSNASSKAKSQELMQLLRLVNRNISTFPKVVKTDGLNVYTGFDENDDDMDLVFDYIENHRIVNDPRNIFHFAAFGLLMVNLSLYPNAIIASSEFDNCTGISVKALNKKTKLQYAGLAHVNTVGRKDLFQILADVQTTLGEDFEVTEYAVNYSQETYSKQINGRNLSDYEDYTRTEFQKLFPHIENVGIQFTSRRPNEIGVIVVDPNRGSAVLATNEESEKERELAVLWQKSSNDISSKDSAMTGEEDQSKVSSLLEVVTPDPAQVDFAMPSDQSTDDTSSDISPKTEDDRRERLEAKSQSIQQLQGKGLDFSPRFGDWIKAHNNDSHKFLSIADISEEDLGYDAQLRPVPEGALNGMPQSLEDIRKIQEIIWPKETVFLISNESGRKSIVRLGFLKDGRPVALKRYIYEVKNQMEADVKGAWMADKLGMGRFHGMHKDNEGRMNLVMDIIPGRKFGFDNNQLFVTKQTFQDLIEIYKRTRDNGVVWDYWEAQFIVTPQGRLFPVDHGFLSFSPNEKKSRQYYEYAFIGQFIWWVKKASEKMQEEVIQDLFEHYKDLFHLVQEKIQSEKMESPLKKIVADIPLVSESDPAMLVTKESESPGGIDLNPNQMDLRTKGDDSPFYAPIDPVILKTMVDIEGAYPVIINVTPVLNLPYLLGVEIKKEEEQYSYL